MTPSKLLNLALLISIASYLSFNEGKPLIAKKIWGEEYKERMFACDHVMREHYIAKMTVEHAPSPQAIKNLQASEMGLLECHKYDKLRKELIAWGLTDNDLSLLGIEALEEKEYELERFVKIHEFRY